MPEKTKLRKVINILNIFPHRLSHISVYIFVYIQYLTSLSPNIAVDSLATPSDVKRFRPSCRNLFGDEYYTVEAFTDRMCLFCVDRYITKPNRKLWKNYTQMRKWNINVPKYGATYIDHEGDVYHMNYAELRQSFEHQRNDSAILNNLVSDFHRRALLKCCDDARKCCEGMMSETSSPNYQDFKDDYCPMEWDGDQCWPSVPKNVKFYQTCPDNFFISESFLPLYCVRDSGVRECQSDGTWWSGFQAHYQRNYSITDQTNCWKVNVPLRWTLSKMTVILQIHSIAMVILSIVLLLIYRIKNGLTSTLHLNFYASIILSSSFSLFYEFFITQPHIRDPSAGESLFICRSINMLEKLFRLINFNWMLIEGLNFYQMVVRAQKYNRFKEKKYWLFGFGWAFPVPVIILYGLIRLKKDESTCWTDSIGYWEIALIALPYLACLLNFLFLLNIIYVIMQRFCFSSSSTGNMIAYGVRTSMIMLPIFGVQYILHFIPANTNESCSVAVRNLHFAHIFFEAGQGIIVSLALSLFNREMIVGIGRMFTRPFRKQSKELSGLSTNTNITVYSNGKSFQ